MKRLSKVSCCLVLVIVLFLSASISVAESSSLKPVGMDYSHIVDYWGNFSINNGTAVCIGSGRGRNEDNETLIRVTLQRRKTGGSVWFAQQSWSSTAQGKSWAHVHGEKATTTGYDYRTCVYCAIKDLDGNILESDLMYSHVIPR